uniref:Uncharacterized protein n=1 Tax=Globisporangium ultimum (strain ATCC 200006 / CBS 805.95 / DAOM BR144) TaxID=431595 RepID=K3WCT3_GLOUD
MASGFSVANSCNSSDNKGDSVTNATLANRTTLDSCAGSTHNSGVQVMKSRASSISMRTRFRACGNASIASRSLVNSEKCAQSCGFAPVSSTNPWYKR